MLAASSEAKIKPCRAANTEDLMAVIKMKDFPSYVGLAGAGLVVRGLDLSLIHI